jgi:hypothetical protein
MSTQYVEIYSNSITKDVIWFEAVCRDVVRNAAQRKYTQVEAIDESKRLGDAFKRVCDTMDSYQAFLAEGGELKEGVEQDFLLLSEMDARVRNSFTKAIESIQGIDPSLATKTSEILSGSETERTSHVHVYYNGPGDLFIRGGGAEVRMPVKASSSVSKRFDYGQSEKLSWDRGLPLHRESDQLWKMTLVTKEGDIPRYKFLVSDCLWSMGKDYSTNGAKSLIHIPAFNQSTSSLLVPMNVGFGNKLVLCGKGEVLIQEKAIELSWEKGIDFNCFGPNLWVLPLGAKGSVEFKICLANQAGELIWEKGANRNLITGEELVVIPNFGPGIGKTERMEIASANLGKHLLEKQQLVRNQRDENDKQRKAQISTRQVPCLLKNNAKTFPDDAIIRVCEFSKIEETVIDGSVFQFYYTQNGKAVIIQEAPQGCTAGVSAMLILDNGGAPRAADLLNRKAASYHQIGQDITNAGLHPLMTPVASYGRSLAKLRERILADGPAYVRIKEHPGGVGHAIIVDGISDDLTKVGIRDPWHAMEFIVKGEAFKEAWYCSLDQAEAEDYTVQVRGGVK